MERRSVTSWNTSSLPRCDQISVRLCRRPRRELVAGVRGVDHTAHEAATADREPREHELAHLTTDLGLGCRPVVRLLLRETPDLRHRPILRLDANSRKRTAV